ncbi:MAG: hypothetical protein ACQR33_01150 [Candidatus Saccharibacteria bacterium]
MLASEFLEPYPRYLSEERIHQGADFPIVREVQDYSYAHGLIVHAAMQDQIEQIPPLLPAIEAFDNSNDFGAIEIELLETPGAWKYRNEVNFHALNENMGRLWSPLTRGRWANGNRVDALNFSMNALAIEGMKLYAVRERFVQENIIEDLYIDENKDVLERFTGAVQEIDAAIIVIDAIRKHPNLTVVPAPLQFERGNPKTNADLLVVDTEEKRMVGVQVKTNVTKEDRERYDSSRVVLMDGNVDLGNVRVVRTKKGRSTTQLKPWPGIVATSRVDNIKMHGKHQHISSEYIGMMMRMKMKARTLVGGMRVDHRDLSGAIEERILRKL